MTTRRKPLLVLAITIAITVHEIGGEPAESASAGPREAGALCGPAPLAASEGAARSGGR